ncbi:MAG: hypothetical protein QGD94_07285 [Planctomycetia bacterium]|nr:hypothetical protein [Planctomycetia bacterium]
MNSVESKKQTDSFLSLLRGEFVRNRRALFLTTVVTMAVIVGVCVAAFFITTATRDGEFYAGIDVALDAMLTVVALYIGSLIFSSDQYDHMDQGPRTSLVRPSTVWLSKLCAALLMTLLLCAIGIAMKSIIWELVRANIHGWYIEVWYTDWYTGAVRPYLILVGSVSMMAVGMLTSTFMRRVLRSVLGGFFLGSVMWLCSFVIISAAACVIGSNINIVPATFALGMLALASAASLHHFRTGKRLGNLRKAVWLILIPVIALIIFALGPATYLTLRYMVFMKPGDYAYVDNVTLSEDAQFVAIQAHAAHRGDVWLYDSKTRALERLTGLKTTWEHSLSPSGEWLSLASSRLPRPRGHWAQPYYCEAIYEFAPYEAVKRAQTASLSLVRVKDRVEFQLRRDVYWDGWLRPHTVALSDKDSLLLLDCSSGEPRQDTLDIPEERKALYWRWLRFAKGSWEILVFEMDGRGFRIWSVSQENKAKAIALAEYDYDKSWRPIDVTADGKRVLFMNLADLTLEVFSITTGRSVRIFDASDISPAGANAGAETRLRLFPLQYFLKEKWFYFQEPRWFSPLGDMVLFSAYEGHAADDDSDDSGLYALRTARKEVRKVAGLPRDFQIRMISYAPDGTSLVCLGKADRADISGKTGRAGRKVPAVPAASSIWKIDLESLEVERLPFNLDSDSVAVLWPWPDRLLFYRPRQTAKAHTRARHPLVWTVSLDGTDRRAVFPPD